MYNIQRICSTFYIVHVNVQKMCKKDVPENKLNKQQLYNCEINYEILVFKENS